MTNTAAMPPDRVLVVEDDPETRRALEKSLQRLGYEVHCADDGEVGLTLAVKLKPQVVLTDIKMPRMDGHTFLRRLAGQGVDPSVIMMSAHGTMDDVIDAMRGGAIDYLTKPWTASALISAVARAVEVYEQREAARAATARPHDASSDFETPIRQELDSVLLTGEMVLPPFPPVLAELRSVLARPETAMREVSALVERDPSLATQILRTANSPHYVRGARVTSVQVAVTRLGLRHIQSVVKTIVFRASHIARSPAIAQMQAHIWRYAIARAVAMRGIAELAGLSSGVEPEAAYLSGLLADAGATFLWWLVDQRMPETAASPDKLEKCRVWIRERHQEFGASLLERWELDPASVFIARHHHRDSPPAPPSMYWSVMVLGTALADSLNIGPDTTSQSSFKRELVDHCGADLRIGTSGVSLIAESVHSELEAVMGSLA